MALLSRFPTSNLDERQLLTFHLSPFSITFSSPVPHPPPFLVPYPRCMLFCCWWSKAYCPSLVPPSNRLSDPEDPDRQLAGWPLAGNRPKYRHLIVCSAFQWMPRDKIAHIFHDSTDVTSVWSSESTLCWPCLGFGVIRKAFGGIWCRYDADYDGSLTLFVLFPAPDRTWINSAISKW